MSFTDCYNLRYTTDATSTDAFQTDLRQRWDIKAFDEGTRSAEKLQNFDYLQPISQREIIVRLLCYLYVGRMPASGSQELYVSLREMVGFYNELPTKEQVALSEPIKIKAKVMATVMRPDFSLDHDT